MNPDNLINGANEVVSAYLLPFGWKILGAIGVWIVGSWIVRFVAAAFARVLIARKVDPTLGRYLETSATVEILEFNPMGAVIAVRPYCHNNHYWQVYFDTNKAISDVCGEAGYPVPETRHGMRTVQ